MKQAKVLRTLPLVMICLVASIVSFALSAKSQSPADIEKIVRGSKWIDKTRPVRAVVSGNLVTISTYCHPRASDQDCKINSLFILKELMQHFKTVQHLKISFFDPANAILFRTVDVKEGDTALVDAGKPVQEVLSQIDIVRGKLNSQRKMGGSSSQLRSASSGSSTAFARSGRFKQFSSADGDFSIEFPENWQTVAGHSPGSLCSSTYAMTQVLVNRYAITPTNTFEMVVEHNERVCILNFKGFKKQEDKHESFNRNSGVYMQGTFEPKSSVRCFFLHGRDHCYAISLMNYGGDEKELEEIFRRILSSVIVRG